MIAFTGQVWRIVFQDQDATLPARAPEGRFHHSGQTAIYTSLTPEGCATAITRYLRPDDPARLMATLRLNATHILDLRGRGDVSVVWQDIRASGAPAPTWRFSDAARAMGAQGMLYSSRSRPELDHLVLFDMAQKIALRAVSSQPWHPAP
ncbi:MAG: RES family NAD+ phosphorylase [Paracoccaceae bacterium]|nr:RES family NAD+ phosphorylase [Paracoccaceae bacterium]